MAFQVREKGFHGSLSWVWRHALVLFRCFKIERREEIEELRGDCDPDLMVRTVVECKVSRD